ncbi:MAG: HD domain-containing protein [Alkalibacterium sp.]|uniref:HD/PDEase domain-containing protein n=1 Tax=Alkalibacterium gilvum TaxID=1130080 RepID=A0A1H6TPQ9_9LACT|nr:MULTISPECIES: HD domain-containing protein [Alkalibacterium]MDN6194231.1 HD domain-containing protein [Alkalibacterium sp.]MDN6293291.1 HD domain-containing protein [Alkalibacterium sp.]MDN6295483.1 HD domain-containing protein [Alkalibacterium sp.]MDN6327195.1 HD domain-containing protein [Alkalibacterium sp.]MDN6397751.1 HD domain-containing protein [Alkalibacterium sp.]
MYNQTIIDETKQMVRSKLLNEGSGHDWYHIERVWKTALNLAEKEKANRFIVELAALLHDLIDDKIVSNKNEAVKEVLYWLEGAGVSSSDSEKILEIIENISFKGGNNKRLHTIEAQVVQDADRLDAIGAIGIARCFAYAGSKGTPIFDPEVSVRETMTEEEYRKGKSSAVHHFYEKLFKLKDLMNTKAAREVAEERHKFMEDYLTQFFNEWEGQ